MAGIVSFNVGGTVSQVLESVIRSRPDTLLCTLLDEPGRKEQSAPIFIDRNADMFNPILDWYRHGFIITPPTVSLERMRLECAYYQLPDDVQIRTEQLESSLSTLRDWHADTREKAQKELTEAVQKYSEAAQSFVAALAFCNMVSSLDGQSPAAIDSGVEGTLVKNAKCRKKNRDEFYLHYEAKSLTIERTSSNTKWWTAVGNLVRERGQAAGLDCALKEIIEKDVVPFTVKTLKRKREEMEA
mmetsp:Transcript_10814/g.19621  ORF Transcript_10814/g.19621 Transcript_10814/m.19621 type:complete len:243 (-) Transcript_10814:112-840(-)